jgi:hypothetical protein
MLMNWRQDGLEAGQRQKDIETTLRGSVKSNPGQEKLTIRVTW